MRISVDRASSVVLSAILIISLVGPGFANKAGVTAWEALTNGELNLQSRTEIASNISSYCETFSSAIPQLSPRESDWLEDEINAGRSLNAIGSSEFLKKAAGNQARSCVSVSRMLLRFLRDNENSQVNRGEASLWAVLSSVLLDESLRDYVPRLTQQGEVQLNEEQVQSSFFSLELGRTVLRRVVIPYLQGPG